MGIDRSHTGACAHTLAATVMVAQVLWSSCQPDASSAGANAGSSASSSASTTTPAASAGRAAAPAAAQTASTAGRPSAGGAEPLPAANSGSLGRAGADGTGGTGAAGSTAQAGSGTASSPQAGSGGTTTSPPQAGSESAAGQSATAGEVAAGSGSLPDVTDFKTAGPFTPKRAPGPSGYVLFYPEELGKDGAKHPIVSWGPGAVETASDFVTMLSHIASHGFAVISFDATPQGQELITGIDFMLAENARADSVFYQKLDPTKISAGGHSAGSLATFAIGSDPRLVTTLHISGGTFDPHTDIMNLHAPALFVCGEPGGDGLLVGDVAHANCEIDFMNATVPVFYGITKGASHMTPTEIGDPAIRTHQLGAMVGWLRWQLLGDMKAGSLFTGDACMLCSDPAWSTAKAKNLM